jgi:mRNA degradation ribonuclease J1/J2
VSKRTNGDLRDEIEQATKSLLYHETKRRPMVYVTISRV